MNWITIGGVHYNMDQAVSIEPRESLTHIGYKINLVNEWVCIDIPINGPCESEDSCAYTKIKHTIRNAGTHPEKS